MMIKSNDGLMNGFLNDLLRLSSRLNREIQAAWGCD